VTLTRTLAGVLAVEDLWNRAQKNAEIHADAALANQFEVHAATLRIRQAIAPRDLPQARDSRLHLQDFLGVGAVISSKLSEGHGARSHQRHLTRDHMPQLRQLVDRMAAAESREPIGNPWIARAL